jgi:hypothetical protein
MILGTLSLLWCVVFYVMLCAGVNALYFVQYSVVTSYPNKSNVRLYPGQKGQLFMAFQQTSERRQLLN